MALEPLTSDIAASATVAADLTEVSTLRSTQQVTQVLYNTNPKLRATQQITQVLYNINPKLRVTQQVVLVLYKESTAEKLNLTAAIAATATVTAQLKIPKIKSSIQASGLLAGVITGVRQYNSSIVATGNLSANLDVKVKLAASITAEGDVTTANLRKNIEYLNADVTATGDITTAAMFVPWHAGNTLQLRQSATANIIKYENIQHDLNLQQQVNLIFGQRSFYLINNLTFTHNATVIRVLPVKTASNTLVLTQLLSDYRNAHSYLNLRQVAVGSIYFIPASATNVLNLTHSAIAEKIINTNPSSELNLTHLVDWDQITSKSVLSNLNLSQYAFAVILASKKYVLLQAPFNLIQTSVILPNPLLDDNESLVSNLMLRRSMTNIPYTYIQSTKNRRLRYTFILNRMKALELEAFFDSYNGADIKMLNWKGEIWRVKLITNPVDFVQTHRAEPGGDRTDVNLEFEGVLLNG